MKDLFHDYRHTMPEKEDSVEGHKILKSEAGTAIAKMKLSKSAGPDGIVTEMITALEDYGIDKLTDVINKIYDSGEFQADLCKSIFVIIPKKPGAIHCEHHRLISFMSHVTKIIMRILFLRARNRITPEIGVEQFGFVKDSGTRNAIFTLRNLVERAIEMKRDVFLCFINYTKAFDKVRHDSLFKDLKTLNLPGKDYDSYNICIGTRKHAYEWKEN